MGLRIRFGRVRAVYGPRSGQMTFPAVNIYTRNTRYCRFEPAAIQEASEKGENSMRSLYGFALVVTTLFLVSPAAAWAQPPAQGQAPGRGPRVGGPGSPAADGSHAVTDGGIKIPGWQGKIDANEEKAGMTINDAKLTQEGDSLHVVTGPAVSYWKTSDKASGDYTVKATFYEPKYMNLNTHPHPYGLFIAGNGEGTPSQTDLYCSAAGNGNFIVRGFGPAPFQMNGRGEINPAVHKAAGVGQPVTQEIALSVRGGKVECAINGTVVASYDKAALVTEGKLKSTDGSFGLRMAHNTEVIVTGLTVTKN
jgi:hypothetical protein